MRGTNPIRQPKNDDGSTLDVQAIFATLQGEGPNAGTPAVFVRLGGCNLACDFCDTEFESFAAQSIGKIVDEVIGLAFPPRAGGFRGESSPTHYANDFVETKSKLRCPPPQAGEAHQLVVITGGEPLRQNIVPLCEALIAKNFRVQIETNGTLFRELPKEVEIVCSPKNTGQGYAPIRADLLPRVSAFKYLVSASHPLYRDVPVVSAVPIYVQPMDEIDAAKNAANREYAKRLALANGYRLSLQLHKILDIP